MIERFTRVADNALLYRFTVEDPGTWVAPWTGEYTWPATNEQIYEYACHEANYAMENILRGARQREAEREGEAVDSGSGSESDAGESDGETADAR